jgi:putative transcriptional regulator
MNETLNNRIRVFRAEHRMSQADLAAAIGVSRKTISTIEVGRFAPSLVIAMKIARFFHVPVEEVFSLDAASNTRRVGSSS